MTTHDTFELELTDMAHGGSALGRHGKRTIFVPYTIPGERIRARITQDKGRIAFAEGVQLLEASADRVYPRCPHFGPGRCGRCQWQHIDYPAQLLLKQDVLADQLARIGGFDDATLAAAVRPVIPSPAQWGYNYHMTLEKTSPADPRSSHGSRASTPHLTPQAKAVWLDKDKRAKGAETPHDLSSPFSGLGSPVAEGFEPSAAQPHTPQSERSAPVLGFPSADGRSICPIDECHILHPDLLDLYHRLDLDFGGARRVKLQLGSDGAHMVILMMTDENAPELVTDLPTSVNLLLPDNEPVNLIGEAHSRYQVAGRTFRVTAGSSFRAHVAQLENLVAAVMDAANLAGGENVLDLYAGVGLFGAFLAARARLVTLVESYPPAATDADLNLADFDNVDVIEGSVEDVLGALEETYHAAVVDPPPDGLSLEAMDRLAALRIPRLVYVSGDPATLARDGQRLAGHGYRLIRAQPIDLAPQTFYIDTVAAFVL